MINFDDLSKANKERQDKNYPQCNEWSLTDWATAISGECGEMCNLIKKIRRGDNIDLNDVSKEIADIVIYADLISQKLNFNLGKSVKDKFNEVSERVGSDIKIV